MAFQNLKPSFFLALNSIFLKIKHKIDFVKKLFNYENTGRKKEAGKNLHKTFINGLLTMAPIFRLADFPSALPIANSIASTGIPIIIEKNTYKKRNIPPPFFPTIHGNFHSFPQPMAQSALIKIKPKRL